MRVAFLPRYGEWAASSRLRVYAVAAAINAYGLGSAVIGAEPADVVVIQKATDRSIFERAQTLAPRVVYDVDDVIDHATLAMAVSYARLITVDTPRRAAAIASRLPSRCGIAVVPDALDYEGSGPRPIALGSGAVWFGNYPNFESVRWMIRALCDKTECGAISDLTQDRAGLPLKLCRWDLETFPSELRRWGVAVLSHRGADPCKSANKMAAAYHLGLPCIVSDSEDYKDLAWAAGLHWTYVANEAELLAAHERLEDPQEREEAVRRGQSEVWQRYRREAVARRALEAYGAA